MSLIVLAGNLVSIPSSSGTMANLWDIDTGKEIPGFRDKPVDAVAFSPCGHKIACGMGKKIRLWDVNSCRTLWTLPHDIYPNALAFSPCGKYLASGLWWNRGVETEKVPMAEIVLAGVAFALDSKQRDV